MVVKIQPRICLNHWGKPRNNPNRVGRHRDLNQGPRALPRKYKNKTNKSYGHIARIFSRLLSDILIWERCISISSRFQMIDNHTFLAVSPADLITSQQKRFHVCHSIRFLCELPLIWKWKGRAGDNYKSALILFIYFKRYVRRQIENWKNIILVTRIFSGKNR